MPDETIREALDRDMSLLREMGVNCIRQHSSVPAKWIQYIYEKYGIWTMNYSSFGRYGLTVDGVWHANTDYEDPKVARTLLEDAMGMIKEYNGTPGLLMYMLGNENNYGLFWKGAEAENLPMEDRSSTKQAHALYKIMNDAAIAMKKANATAPIAICNGDLLFIDIIAKECTDVDLLGVNVYRGPSFGDLFDRVKAECGRPVFFSEFGSDAYNARTNNEAQKEQADILLKNWEEIYANAYGLGKAGNSIGGFTFQFIDGWWKTGQSYNLEQHDATASWSNGAYTFDYVPGENNMNEEWFGICAKGLPDINGIYEVYPRAAYYALKEVHTKFNPFSKGVTADEVSQAIAKVNTTNAMLAARGDKAALEAEKTKLFSISELRGDFLTHTTGGYRTSTPKKHPDHPTGFPSFKGFDHTESFYVGVKAQPTSNVSAEVTVNVLGNVAENPIDEIFYENRGRSRYTVDENGEPVNLGSLERVKIYSAAANWDAKAFSMNVFYRKPHYHWGYEGDFFGFYPEASYGDNMDIYGGEAPFGAEFAGKKKISGLKFALGPELWWGANPAILAKYNRDVKGWNLSGIFHWDVAQRTGTVTSYVIPRPKNTRAAIAVEKKFGKFDITLGGLWSGVNLVGREFQATTEDKPDATVYVNKVKTSDTFGGKAKVVFSGGAFNAYVRGAYMGLVAAGGQQYAMNLTGWSLKDCGSGNQTNVLAGFTYQAGNFQVAPNFLWQKPLVGPMPNGIQPPGRLRNIIDDPFAVRENREQTAGEILLTYDPTAMAACAKHFIGYGAAEGGRDYNSTHIPERLMRNVYLPSFKAAADAGCATFMTSFNDNDGVPSTANKHLLTDILRNEWNYDGMVVTDWCSATEMIAHGFVKDAKDAAEKSINAGVDMDMVSESFIQNLDQLVKEGKVSQKTIDNAVRNVLRLKFHLGLFDNPYVTTPQSVKYAPEHLAAAQKAAEESAILLENRNSILPLTDKVKNILVVGPMADADYEQLGTWVFDGEREHTQTPLKAIREMYGEQVNVNYLPVLTFSRDKDRSRIAKAVQAAKAADVVLAFVGEEAILSGEAHSLAEIKLQGVQTEMIKEPGATGTPLVTVIMAGRQLVITDEAEASDALIYMFHPGTMGGPAIANILFGKANPSGKTPVTFPRTQGQTPLYYAQNNTGRPANPTEMLVDEIPIEAGQTSVGCRSFYLDAGTGPLYPFGYGLSYSHFTYDDLTLSAKEIGKDGTLAATVTLKNDSQVDGTEVVQLYVQDKVGSITRPVKELKGFRRVSLKAGESTKVTFELPISALAFYGYDNTYNVEAGDFRLWIGPSSQDGPVAEFAVTE